MAISGGTGAALGGAYGEIVLRTEKSEANVKRLQGTITQFGQSAGSSFDRVATGLGLLGAARGLGNLFAGAIGGAATFEQRMSAVGAVADATSDQLAALRDEAIRIGRDTAFSASQGAEALEELAKAGVSVEDILAGASRGAVALGAAAGIGIPQSATIIANALNQFGLAGDQAVRVADLIAAASSTSSAGAQDIGEALAYVGTSAAALSIPIEDTVAGIAALADVGIVGSRAGTSLAAALNAVVAPTAKASGQMAALGIAATDLNGNFVGLDSLLEQVATATGTMGDAQRQAALDAIFGVEGGRAINALLATQSEAAAAAGKSWEDYQENVGQAGAAADQAAKRQDNFAGSVEQLRGSIETAAIVVGSIFLPALRDVVDIATTAVNAFTSLPTPLLAIAGAGVGAGAGILGVAGALTLAGPKLGEFAANLAGTRKAMLGLAKGHPVLLGIAGAAALAGLAYKTNFGGIATITDSVVDTVQRRLGYFTKGFSTTFRNLNRVFKGKTFAEKFFSSLGVGLRDALGINGKAADQFIKRFNAIGRVASGFEQGVGRMTGALGDVSRIIQRDGLAEGIDRLFGDKGQDLLRGFGEAAGTLPRVFGMVLGSIKTGIGPIDSILANAGAGFEQLGGTIEAVFSGDFSLAGETLANAVGRFLTAGGTAFDLAVDVVVSIGTFIAGTIPDLWDAVKRFAFGLAGGNSDAAAVDTLLAAGGVGNGLTIGEVGVQIQTWAVDAVVGVYDAIKDWVSGKTGGLGANTGGIGAGGSFSGGGLPIAGVGLQIVSWAVDAVVGVYDAIKTWVSGHTGGLGVNTGGIGAAGSFSGGGIPLSDIAISIGSWAVDATADLITAVNTKVDELWSTVKGSLDSVEDAAVKIGSWVVDAASAAVSLGAVVNAKVDELWPAAQAAISDGYDVVVDIARIAIGAIDGFAQDAAGRFQTFLTDNAIPALSAYVDISSVVPSVDAAAIGDYQGAVKAFLEAEPITLNPTFKLNLTESVADAVRGDGGGGGGGDDGGGLFSGGNPFFKIGLAIGDKIGGLVKDGLDIGFGGVMSGLFEQGISEEYTGAGGLRTTPGLVQGLSDDLLGGLQAWADGIGDLLAPVVATVRTAVGLVMGQITDIFSGGGDGGMIDNRSGQQLVGSSNPGGIITGLIADIFDFELPSFDFPDLVTPVTTWLSEQIESIKTSFTNAVPDWMKKLAGGDVIGAVKALGLGEEEKPPDAQDLLKDVPIIGGGGETTGQAKIIGRGIGLAGGRAIGMGFTDAGPEVQRRISELFNLGDGEAETSGKTKGGFHAAGIAAGITAGQGAITTASQAALNAARLGGGAAPPPQGGPPKPAAAPTAPPPVVFPAPNLTAYLGGLATAATALQTTVSVLGLTAQTLGPSLGAAAAAAIGVFNANLASGWITAVQITIGGIGAIKGAAAGGSLFGEGAALGSSFGLGVLSSLSSFVGLVYAAGAALGQAAVNGAKSTIRPGSPSRAAIELFATVPQGAVKAMVDGLTSVRAAGQRLAGAALIPPMTPTFDVSRLLGQQQTSTAQMLGAQPTGRAGSGGGTVIHQQVFALRSDELVQLMRQAEQGEGAAVYVGGLHGAFAGMMG